MGCVRVSNQQNDLPCNILFTIVATNSRKFSPAWGEGNSASEISAHELKGLITMQGLASTKPAWQAPTMRSMLHLNAWSAHQVLERMCLLLKPRTCIKRQSSAVHQLPSGERQGDASACYLPDMKSLDKSSCRSTAKFSEHWGGYHWELSGQGMLRTSNAGIYFLLGATFQFTATL